MSAPRTARERTASPPSASRRTGVFHPRSVELAAARSAAPQIVHQVLRSPGRSLDPATRTAMEARLGHDFSQVRVHADARAAESARAVNARAYTVGRDVVFGAGQYAPGTRDGEILLAHELTHVLQQRARDAEHDSLQIGPSDDRHETSARGVASALRYPTGGRSGAPVRPASAPTWLQRTPETGPPAAAPAGPTFSVDQTVYLRRVDAAIGRMAGPIVGRFTLTDVVQPILLAARAHVTWRDETGADHGGGAATYSLPGTPPLSLNLRLVLDDQLTPPDAGRFEGRGTTDATVIVRIRRNPTTDDLMLTLFHESLHLAQWIIASAGASRLGGAEPRAVQALTMTNFPAQIASIRLQLDALASSVNPRRAAAGQPQITGADLGRMAPWLMEEVQVRAETEVFRLASEEQRARTSGRPGVFLGTMESVEVSRDFVNRYVFEHSRVFLPTDAAGLTPEDRRVLALLTDVLRRFFQHQVTRRISLSLFRHTPRAPFPWTPPPLTPPTFPPLPVP